MGQTLLSLVSDRIRLGSETVRVAKPGENAYRVEQKK